MRHLAFGTLSCALLILAPVSGQEIEEVSQQQENALELRSIGPIAFGPAHTLFVSDPKAATITALDVRSEEGPGVKPGTSIEDLGGKIAAKLGTEPRQIRILDVAVNPTTQQIYLAVARGRGQNSSFLLLKIDEGGAIAEVTRAKILGKAEIQNAPAARTEDASSGRRRRRNPRMESITDLAFVSDKVIVAGLSNEEFSSTLRAIAWPFGEADEGASVEIYHGAHGRYETNAPVRTFVPYQIGDQMHIVAAYTCTPLVVFPMSDLTPGKHVKGRTVAELGNRNRPLDMIEYTKDGDGFLLMANSSRGVMKIPTKDLGDAAHIEEHVSGGRTAGVGYETIQAMQGVVQLDKLDAEHAVVLARDDDGKLVLKTVRLP